jgi:hypothetical protein
MRTQVFTTKTCLLAESDDAESAVTVVVVAGSEVERRKVLVSFRKLTYCLIRRRKTLKGRN